MIKCISYFRFMIDDFETNTNCILKYPEIIIRLKVNVKVSFKLIDNKGKVRKLQLWLTKDAKTLRKDLVIGVFGEYFEETHFLLACCGIRIRLRRFSLLELLFFL